MIYILVWLDKSIKLWHLWDDVTADTSPLWFAAGCCCIPHLLWGCRIGSRIVGSVQWEDRGPSPGIQVCCWDGRLIVPHCKLAGGKCSLGNHQGWGDEGRLMVDQWWAKSADRGSAKDECLRWISCGRGTGQAEWSGPALLSHSELDYMKIIFMNEYQ